MGFIARFQKKHPALFVYKKADEVHPHDRFIERTVLRFLPASLTPNTVTAIRVGLTPIVFLLILYKYYRIGVLLFVITAFTDAIDGSLARTKDKITEFGMLFDPFADKLLIGSLVFLLVFQIDFFLAVATLGLEIIIIISALVAKIKFKTTKMANRWGKIKMLLQVIATSLVMIALLIDFPVLVTIAAWCFGIAIGFAMLSLFRGGL